MIGMMIRNTMILSFDDHVIWTMDSSDFQSLMTEYHSLIQIIIIVVRDISVPCNTNEKRWNDNYSIGAFPCCLVANPDSLARFLFLSILNYQSTSPHPHILCPVFDVLDASD